MSASVPDERDRWTTVRSVPRSAKRFSYLSGRSRALIVLGAAVQVVLQGAALRDIARRPAAEVNGPRLLWAALSFVNFVGPIAYFLMGRRPA